MFDLAQTNIFTPERKKGGAITGDSSPTAGRGWAWGGVEWVGNAWVGTPTWSALLGIRGFQPRGGEPGDVCRGGARHRHPAQAQAQARRSPRWRPPCSRTPPTPRAPSPRHWGPSPPPWTAKARYVDCVLAVI